MKNLIGMVTFGNIAFTQLAIQGIRETVKEPYDLFLIVGKPEDEATVGWLQREGIPHIAHDYNYGFPYSVNDIYDYAWKENNYDNLIILGNDVIPYPDAIDNMIILAGLTQYDWICGREYNVKALVRDKPETKAYFSGPNLVFNDFGTAEPWKKFDAPVKGIKAEKDAGLSDVHNLTLFKKKVFENVGYIDVSFYPAYYEDNDYVRRAILAGTTSCRSDGTFYFHFWSRTIHQETGGSNSRFFNLNRNYYIAKWGGDFGQEKFDIPFNGEPFSVRDIPLCGDINIQTRENEKEIIREWRRKGF